MSFLWARDQVSHPQKTPRKCIAFLLLYILIYFDRKLEDTRF